jgi:hypothetical protein
MGLTVRAGVFFPATTAGSALGDNWFTAGIELDVFKLGFLGFDPLQARLSLSVDTYTRSNASSLPILANFVKRQGRLKLSAGAGIAITNLPAEDSEVRFAYQFSLGYDLPWLGIPVMAEVRWFGVNGASNLADGIAVTLGLRL